MVETDARALDPGSTAKPRPPRAILWRTLFVALAAGWIAFFYLHPDDLLKVGVPHYRETVGSDRFHDIWFFDSFAILASNDALSAGRDPYAPNPLDPQNRPHVYGPAWLHLRDFGLTRGDNLYVGLALDVGFFIAAMFWLRPRDAASLLWCLAVFCTTPVLVALERANNDLAMFLLLTPVVPCLLARAAGIRMLAAVFVAAAADLKFYPAVAVVVLFAHASPRELRWRLAVTTVLLLLVGWHLAGALPKIIRALPVVEGIFTFGGVAGFHELGWRGPWPQLVATFLGVVALAACWRLRLIGEWRSAASQRGEWLDFILGAVLLAGCFFTGESHDYRLIFALWMAPFLWTLSRDDLVPVAVRRLARATGGLLLVALWFDAVCALLVSRMHGAKILAALHWAFLFEQPLTWAFFVCVLVFLAHFGRTGWRRLRSPG